VIQPRYNSSLRSAASIVVAGSNNGINWYFVSRNNGLTYQNGIGLTIPMNGTVKESFSYYRIIALQLIANPSSLWELTSFNILSNTVTYPPVQLSSQQVSGQSYGNGTYTITSNQSLNSSLGGSQTIAHMYGVLGNPFPDTIGGYPILSISTQSYITNAGTYTGGSNTNVNVPV
jgi:hypothetical protein